MKKYKEKQKVKGKLFMMLLISTFSLFTTNSCFNHKKENNLLKNNIRVVKKDSILSYNLYTDKNDTECNTWRTNNKLDILGFINSFKKINYKELNKCFGNFPCGIKGVLISNNKLYNYNLNAGGWLILKNANKTIYLGCFDRKDSTYFKSIYYCDEDWGD